MKNILYILPFLIFFISCDDMNSFHEEYIKDGETIYSVKTDSVISYPGRNRIMIKAGFAAAPHIKQFKIDWNDGTESQTYDIEGMNDTTFYEFLLENLEEQSYIFELYSLDADGNRSIKVDEFASVYGDKYESTLNNRMLLGIEGGGTVDSIIVKWATAADGNTGVEMMYNNGAGEPVTKMVLPEENDVVIRDWELEGEMSYKSFFIPDEYAIDTFATETATTLLPDYNPPIDDKNWEIVDFSSEEPAEGAPNGLASAVIDGDVNTFWHSAWAASSPDYPHYFVVDMKETVEISAVECFRRQGNGGGQTKFKIYTSVDGVNFDDQGTFDFDSQIDDGQMYPLESLPEARYLKYEATEGPNNFAFLGELNIYQKFDKTGWTVNDFSSEEPAEGAPNGLVSAAIDGDVGTFWHSAWSASSPDYPHYFVIDMQETVNMSAVECFRRQGNGGGHTQFKIYTSNDAVNFDDQGTFDFDSQIDDGQMYPLGSLPEARYFKFEATDGPNNFTFLAEIDVYGSRAKE